MKRKILSLVAIALSVSVAASAQTGKAEKESREKQEKVTKEKETDRKKSGVKEEKMTIVIDGNDITVNGKPLDELKEEDAELFREKGLHALTPGMKGLMQLGGVKMFGGGDAVGNKAFLGVTSNASDKGAKVVSVQKESPAERAGIQKDDIITRVDSKKIENSGDLYKAIGEYKPEDKVTVTYLRDGKEQTASVTLGKNKNQTLTMFGNGDLGGNFKSFDFDNMPELRNLEGIEGLRDLKGLNGMNFSMNRKPRLGVQIQDVEEGKGVKVLDVDDNTPAGKAGLKKDDVISAIDGKSIDSVDQLQSAIRGMKEGDSFTLTYKRNGQVQTADIKFPKKLKTADL